MKLQQPRVSTRSSHTVSVVVDDGPVIHLTRGYRDPTPDPKQRIRVSLLHISYNDGDLFTVELRGTQLRADGEPFERGTSGAVNYVDDDGQLRPETPDWVREVVEAHPWPVGDDEARGLERAAAMVCQGGEELHELHERYCVPLLTAAAAAREVRA